MIEYLDTLDGVTAGHLRGGFFEGWPDPPSPEAHLRILTGSSAVVLARDGEHVVGFVTAVGDGACSAYIPLLEVLPGYQRRGVGTELVRRMLAKLDHLYMVDLLCNPHLQPFYGRLGMKPAAGMMVRNYGRQSCVSPGR